MAFDLPGMLRQGETGVMSVGNRVKGRVSGGFSPTQSYQVSPQAQGLLSAQQTSAAQFRSGLPGFQEEQYRGAEGAGRRNLAAKMGGIKADTSKRGLLYSGLRAGQQQQAGSDVANQLAGQRMNINLSSLDMANQMENQAILNGLQMQQMKQQLADEQYNRNLAGEQKSHEGPLGLTRGTGGAIGSLFSA